MANVLSWLGDYAAKAAITALVYDRTGSVALSATAFAVAFLPWLVGGPLLAALAERHRYRSVMVGCDLARATTMALVAIPGMPIGAMIVLLLVGEFASPPFQAARSALLPQILSGDRYVVGLSLQASTGQAAQVVGYAVGAVLTAVTPQAVLIANALTFIASAALIRFGVGDHGPLGQSPVTSRHLGRETLDGFRVVFGNPLLRAIALLVFSVMLFAAVPEALAAAWAVDLSSSRAGRGWIQGLIMMAAPIGFILGGPLVGRLVRPDTRRRLVQPFSVLAPLSLVPAFVDLPLALVVVMCAGCGLSVAGLMPAANGLFVQELPHSHRARAFGIMQGGVQSMQGVGVVVTGLLADRYGVRPVIGGWSLAGVVLLGLIWLLWPGGPPASADRTTTSRIPTRG